MKQNIAIIPARGGSKEIPRKNLKFIYGKPLLAHSIEAAKSSTCIERVIVSTDDEEIAGVAEKYGAEVVMRPESLSTDDSPSEEALIHTVETLERTASLEIGFIVFLQATSPIRPVGVIDKCLKKLRENNGDSLLTVTLDHLFYWREELGAGKSVHNYQVRPMRQQAKKEELIYKENGSIYIMKRDILMKERDRLGGKIILFPMRYEDSFGIDSEFDFWLTERVFEWKNLKK